MSKIGHLLGIVVLVMLSAFALPIRIACRAFGRNNRPLLRFGILCPGLPAEAGTADAPPPVTEPA
ncbi:MAG: hypothetical protein HY847_19255 [Betaproteobacteria bacterium]|nr:hypothetical protein [Betaproteobacteria bacterium]